MGNQACVADDQGLQCWRYNDIVELAGDASPMNLGVYTLSLGSTLYAACAVNKDFSVICWGNDVDGSLDLPENLAPIAHIDLGIRYGCGLTTTMQLFCWGEPLIPVSA